ncbi:hypothetical protein DAPPUDRAFT_113848 [Daphnia pulex]|uniref:Uncharacterized protein n=1 Tax=Daphnia pulex TaxID=6669 RepID=E9HGA7_DAPPU|nr:hypothetical protein DAPPUDRAFT_113848 [Daphnia pulex]|eukprot:EFX69190.1 hypothetical protein DAPPUDRAFT_113848 [Daphnia pulex]
METNKTTPPSQQIPAVIEDTVDNACHDECYNDAIHKSSSIEAQILPKACLTGEDSVGNELVPPVANSSHVESVFRSFPTLTKDQTVQRLALLYSKKSVSLSALSVKSPNFLVIWDMMIPTNKVGQKVMSREDGEPFIVSIFAGHGKPKFAKHFLKPFLTEMLELLSEGLSFDGVQYTIELSAIICNDPARQFVKSIKRQCGYGAFERCTKKVVHIEEHRCRIFSKMLFFVLTIPFLSKHRKNHHIGESPLEQLDIDMISSFPLDYMHLVLLGVFKRLVMI